ncbi:MAG: hypothetical protein M3024_04175 [Candidatus Dormibacteraeota bacterium]|nr:hypothetical protein [Candidatus Dormibacteraeota bacterium]
MSPEQQVHYDFADRDPVSGNSTAILGTNYPEALEAWTVTAMLAIKARVATRSADRRERWQAAIDNEVLQTLPVAEPLRSAGVREAAYARRGDFVLNADVAIDRDQTACSARHRAAESPPSGAGAPIGIGKDR